MTNDEAIPEPGEPRVLVPQPPGAAGQARPAQPVLLDALDRLRGTGPEFGGFLANHGPMAAEALVTLGRAEGVSTWVDRYRTRLTEAPAVRRGIPPGEWRDHLGRVDLAGDWRELIGREAQEMPWTELLARWWGRLLPGLAASATHGLIRTAHAVRSLGAAGPAEHEARPDGLLTQELVQGLALWAARYQPLPGSPVGRGPWAAVTATARLPRLDPTVPSPRPGVGGRLDALDGLDGFPAALDRWGADPDPELALDDLIGAAARVVAVREDAPIAFCHAVTAPAAIRLALPHLPADLQAPSVFAAWQAMAGIVAAFASPRDPAESRAADVPAEDAARDLDQLADAAAWHGDEHVIKLTEAVLREHARRPDPVLLEAATRFRDRVDRPG